MAIPLAGALRARRSFARSRRVFLAAGLLAIAGVSQATNLGFLGRAPISRFNDADMNLLRGALGKALASDKMNVEFSWSNPKTGASGVITPLKALEKDGVPCREVRAINRHPQANATDGVFLLCQRDGSWKMSGKVS